MPKIIVIKKSIQGIVAKQTNIWNFGIIHFSLSKTEKSMFPHLLKSAISEELLDGKIMHTINCTHDTI